jgi:hypothetical protein
LTTIQLALVWHGYCQGEYFVLKNDLHTMAMLEGNKAPKTAVEGNPAGSTVGEVG